MQTKILKSPLGYIDVHCHLTDSRLFHQVEQIVEAAAKENITHFLLGGYDPSDWSRQNILNSRYPENIFTCLGLHPYWISQTEENVCDQALKTLEDLLPDAFALGEVGLDFRSTLLKKYGKQHQIQYFTKQIELANRFKKVPIFHVVRAHEEVLNHLTQQPTLRGGIIHSFNANAKIARRYLDLGMTLSIGGPVTFSNNEALHDSIKIIPLDSLLIESDSPDQKPFNWANEINLPNSILTVGDYIAQLRGTTSEQILSNSTKNFCRLFGPEIRENMTFIMKR
jgi:TatD DNase family protein